MKQVKPSRFQTALAALIVCGALSGQALAGPKEDYSEGVKRYQIGDLVGAMPFLRKAADGGHAPAQALLGEILDRADDDEEALKYFRMSAEQGYAEGQFGLGAMLSGGEGVPANVPEARRWITKAAEQGLQAAINELATAYLTGGLDISESERKSKDALRWIQSAADNNLRLAVEAMANAYRNGDFGLTADPKQAQAWDEKLRKLTGVRQQGRRNRSN